MKNVYRFVGILCFSLFFFASGILLAQEIPSGKKVEAAPFKTAIITYVLSGFQQGQEVYYIDVVNSKFTQESRTKLFMGALETNEHKLVIYKSDVIYTVDLKLKTSFSVKAKGGFVSIFGETLHFGQTPQKGSFLGKECAVYENDGAKQYYWNGILLKEEITKHPMGDQYNFSKEATDIQIDVDIPAEKFDVPYGIETKDAFKEIAKAIDLSRKVMSEAKEQTEKNWEESKQSYEETKNQQKAFLEEMAQRDPRINKIMDETIDKDGNVDLARVSVLIQENEDQDTLKKVKKFKNGDALIGEATATNGELDYAKLKQLLNDKKEELSQKTSALLDAGFADVLQNHFTEAIKKYTEAIEMDPFNYRAHASRAGVYVALQEYEKAVDDMTVAIDSNSNNSNAFDLGQRGDIYKRMGKLQDALKDYDAAIKIINTKYDAALNRVDQEINDEDLLQSKKDYENWVGHILWGRGNAYYQLGEYEKTIADITKVIDSKPQYILKEAYFLRGLAYNHLKQLEQRIADWKMAQSLGSALVEGEYVNQKKQGPYTWYDLDGFILSRGTYVNDQLEGSFKKYYPSGQIKLESNFKNGQYDGLATWYSEDGKKQKEGMYKDGALVGTFTNFD